MGIATRITTSSLSRFLSLSSIRSVFERDDTAILSILDVGYNRVSCLSLRHRPQSTLILVGLLNFQCIIESPHVSICSSELRQIQHSLIRPQNIIATQQALYAALHRVRDTVIITDDALRIQYTNKTIERILGLKIVSVVAFAIELAISRGETKLSRDISSWILKKS